MEITQKERGKQGERIAAEFLESKGYLVLERNYSFDRAEVDLVCFQPAKRYEDGGEIVFVEVKTRSPESYNQPHEAVNEPKRNQIAKAAEAYLYERRLEGALARFDVVAVHIYENGKTRVEHFEDAFRA